MRTHTQRRRFWLTLSALIVIATAAAAGQTKAAKIDVTGKWQFNVETPASSGTPLVTFQQKSEKLTGRYSSKSLGEVDFEGVIKGRDVSFTLYGFNRAGRRTMVEFKGTLVDDRSMKGKVKVTPGFPGTFSGTRQ